jgi:hypothetical protein
MHHQRDLSKNPAPISCFSIRCSHPVCFQFQANGFSSWNKARVPSAATGSKSLTCDKRSDCEAAKHEQTIQASFCSVEPLGLFFGTQSRNRKVFNHTIHAMINKLFKHSQTKIGQLAICDVRERSRLELKASEQ